MPQSLDSLAHRLATLESAVAKLRVGGALSSAVERWRSDAAATIFHLRNRGHHKPIVVVLGGTGTGKSTIVNRLLESEVSARSFRRTFTSGAVAIVQEPRELPAEWLSLPREWPAPDKLPVQGEVSKLIAVVKPAPLTNAISLVDTPDLDGDQPLHHAEADRAFRWAEALVFLVTPEKYQMTELLPYYRLARRYALPAVFVMNKCEESAVLEDYRRQLAEREWTDAKVFAIARDDAGYEPPPDANLPSLRTAVANIAECVRVGATADLRREALHRRSADVVGRLRDQVLSPLKDHRREIDRLVAALRSMTAPAPGVDVSPITQQLHRRLQEQSVLYLMGPQRFLQRVRQVPGLVVRLPRTVWDLLVRGKAPQIDDPAQQLMLPGHLPDFPRLLCDQFRVHQSRIEDLLLGSRLSAAWTADAAAQTAVKLDPADAGKIADEELTELKQWLEQRWNKTPRDTAILNKLLSILPGGRRLSRFSEAAPYLLAIVLAVHGAFFGPVDLMILGSYTLATWVGEKLSNEVAARTRQTNRNITARFSKLASDQITRVCAWLESQSPPMTDIHRLEKLADEVE